MRMHSGKSSTQLFNKNKNRTNKNHASQGRREELPCPPSSSVCGTALRGRGIRLRAHPDGHPTRGRSCAPGCQPGLRGTLSGGRGCPSRPSITLIKKQLPTSSGGSKCLQRVGWDPEQIPEHPQRLPSQMPRPAQSNMRDFRWNFASLATPSQLA